MRASFTCSNNYHHQMRTSARDAASVPLGRPLSSQPPLHADAMKQWLKYEGSPRSRIERAVFTNEGPRMGEEYASFDVRR